MTQAKCAEWVSKYKAHDLEFDIPATYWLGQFTLLNKDLLQYKRFQRLKNILKEKNARPSYVQERIMSTLKELDTRVVRLFFCC